MIDANKIDPQGWYTENHPSEAQLRRTLLEETTSQSETFVSSLLWEAPPFCSECLKRWSCPSEQARNSPSFYPKYVDLSEAQKSSWFCSKKCCKNHGSGDPNVERSCIWDLKTTGNSDAKTRRRRDHHPMIRWVFRKIIGNHRACLQAIHRMFGQAKSTETFAFSLGRIVV